MNKKFIVQEDKGIVIAIKDEFDSVFEEIAKKCSTKTFAILAEIISLSMTWKKLPELEIETQFKGISKCDEYDTFDIKKGKDIASCKADMKYHKAMTKKYKLILDILGKTLYEIQELYNLHNDKTKNIEKDIQRHYYQ